MPGALNSSIICASMGEKEEVKRDGEVKNQDDEDKEERSGWDLLTTKGGQRGHI